MIKRICIAFVLFTLHLGAQNWAPLGKGFDNGFFPRTMVADTINNRLICGGDFRWINSDSLTGQGIAVWNGVSWDSLGNRITSIQGVDCPPVFRLFWLKDTLYADGFFEDIDPFYPKRRAKFNATTKRWENLNLCGSTNSWSNTLNHDSIVYSGGPDTVCGLSRSMAVFYDGYNYHLTPLDFSDLMHHNNNFIKYLFQYKGIWYVAGWFYNDADNSEFFFAMYNGSHWVPVPGAGTIADYGVGIIKIFNNELYLAGPFFKSQGAPGNWIVKFDGTNWDDLGGGITTISGDINDANSEFTDFTVYKGNLYATGYFFYKNKPADYGLAKFDGTQWCNSGEVFQNSVSDIVFLNDTMYIDGGFTAIGTQTIYGVAKRLNLNFTGDCLTAGINEKNEVNGISIYPNPASNTLNISSKNNSLETSKVEISNTIGQRVLSLNYISNIDISALPPGCYFISIRASNSTHTAKFIKQ